MLIYNTIFTCDDVTGETETDNSFGALEISSGFCVVRLAQSI